MINGQEEKIAKHQYWRGVSRLYAPNGKLGKGFCIWTMPLAAMICRDTARHGFVLSDATPAIQT